MCHDSVGFVSRARFALWLSVSVLMMPVASSSAQGWRMEAKLISGQGPGAGLGIGSAMWGNFALVGAPYDSE